VLAVGHEPRHLDGTHPVQQVSDVIDDILFLESSPYITGEICTSTAARSPAPEAPG